MTDDYRSRKAERVTRFSEEYKRKMVTCEACNGVGIITIGSKCNKCSGTGKIREEDRDASKISDKEYRRLLKNFVTGREHPWEVDLRKSLVLKEFPKPDENEPVRKR